MSQNEKPAPSFEPPVFDGISSSSEFRENENLKPDDCKTAIDMAYRLGEVTIELKDLKRRYFRVVFFSVFCFVVAFLLGSFWFYQEVKSY